jgi:hypothetical protein
MARGDRSAGLEVAAGVVITLLICACRVDSAGLGAKKEDGAAARAAP